ncbi:hypothetical protein [Budvicia aquatica]|uniref:DUF4234 domain-containing protein n=1 Tax=Budvicia aquatica TaxID=82979 RepID=A0A2C6DLR2_9GAMM|nr:hypothetical protein [Budvicia aquatica]PHI31268.1 hypothetical protein CRN84_18945 [Budvicia aquatica]PHI31759.1 hypothetical protein CRN84_21730 [Budvicia aquatica]VFS51555.1 Uncharacterised protein [Budvicia aquatica]VFS52663.1 Uncharacterised protein [Budvicia aquatica]
MQDISTLKNALKTNTLSFVLLSLVSGGIYTLMWLYKNQGIMTKTINNTFSQGSFIIWIAVCFGLSNQLSNIISISVDEYRDSPDSVVILVLLLSLASNVLLIVWAFKAKIALQHYVLTTFKFELKMNVFYTFMFNVFYITYCINVMPEALQKHKIIHGDFQSLEKRHAE